jgi:hypothetical protein
MPKARANLILTTIGCAFALVGGGCIAPWPAPPSNKEAGKSAAIAPASPALPSPSADPTALPPDMTAVLDKIQQVRAIDPAAEPRLLEELRQVPASTWPLVAEQFRASLAYHQQLAEKDRDVRRDTQPIVDMRRAPRPDALVSEPAHRPDPKAELAYLQSAASNDDRPSRPIGSLVDPHGANSESVPVLARSTPYAMPSPVADTGLMRPDARSPAPFTGYGPMYPIAGRTGAPTDVAERENTSGNPLHVATPTAAQTIAMPAVKQAILEENARQSQPIRLPSTQPAAADDNWQELVRKAIADLDHRVSPSPTTTAEVHQHVSLRMLRLLAGDTERALEPIPHISPTEQDYWTRQLFALATYLDHHSQPDDKRRAAASVTHLDEAVSNLRELGALSLRNLSFCKNVYGYGAIEAYETDTFTTGQHVSLYVEVENYHSKSSDKGFCTSLGTTYEVLDDRGKRVSSGDFPDVNDCCRSRRRDFHIQFGLTLPENISPGHYQLQLVVKDRQSDKIGNAKASFEIRSGKK